MTTVNSLSGGRTSSYMAAHYPADYELFSLVCNDDPACAPKDKKLVQMANDKLQKYSSQYGEFIGTTEDSSIIKTMLDLEQILGREIIWLRWYSFDKMIEEMGGYLPNKRARNCTTVLKMYPIFYFLYLREQLPVTMRVGFRFDEYDRFLKNFFKLEKTKKEQDFDLDYYLSRISNEFDQHDTIKWIFDFENIKNRVLESKITKKGDPNIVKYHLKTNLEGGNRNRHEKITSRVLSYPMIHDRVVSGQVRKFFQGKDISFADDSNCQHCFWKTAQQLRKNFVRSPAQMNWAKNMEAKYGNTFHDKGTMASMEALPLQLNLLSEGSTCQMGYCTD
jgi:hypothetical protein